MWSKLRNRKRDFPQNRYEFLSFQLGVLLSQSQWQGVSLPQAWVGTSLEREAKGQKGGSQTSARGAYSQVM